MFVKPVGPVVAVPPIPSATWKNPSPRFARSNVFPVNCVERPSVLCQLQKSGNLNLLVSGSTPPRVAVGAEAPATVCEIKSLKTVLPFLNPYDLTLAMLLPMTSSFVWKFRSPDIPEYIERNM